MGFFGILVIWLIARGAVAHAIGPAPQAPPDTVVSSGSSLPAVATVTSSKVDGHTFVADVPPGFLGLQPSGEQVAQLAMDGTTGASSRILVLVYRATDGETVQDQAHDRQALESSNSQFGSFTDVGATTVAGEPAFQWDAALTDGGDERLILVVHQGVAYLVVGSPAGGVGLESLRSFVSSWKWTPDSSTPNAGGQ